MILLRRFGTGPGTSRSPWRWLGRGVAGLHFGYLAYLITGGFLAWRWPRTFPAHLLAAAWAARIVVTGARCPSTAVQNRLRERAGQPPLASGFIDAYIRGRFFPAAAETATRATVGGIVLASWVGLIRRRRRGAAGGRAMSPALVGESR